MTGLEIGAGAMAVGKGANVAAKALSGSGAESALIREIAKDSPGALVAGSAMGDRMAAKQLTINRLLAPLFWFAGYRREYFESGKFAEDMAAKMTEVPEENIISPAPNVAAQAMEGLSYSLNDPDLKEMYLNLLAAASDSRRADGTHPSYAGVIRQLSAAEAALLPRFISTPRGEPMVRVKLSYKEPVGAFNVLVRHVIDMTSPEGLPIEIPSWALYVDNWVRLGLVVADYDNFRMSDDAYEFAKARPESVRHDIYDPEFCTLEYDKGLLTATDFGLQFGVSIGSSHLPTETAGA